MRDIALTDGVGPTRACIEELLPDVLDGTVTPGGVLDRTFPFDGAPEVYRAVADRQVLRVLIRP